MQMSEMGMQRMLGATIVLLRNTTWKCGRLERLVVNYLRRQPKRGGCTQSQVKDVLEHFKSQKVPKYYFFETIWRLEKRYIIKLVSKPFLSHYELSELKKEVLVIGNTV